MRRGRLPAFTRPDAMRRPGRRYTLAVLAAFVLATAGKFAAIDLNPLFVCTRGKGVRIADALMETMPQADGGSA